MSHAGMLTRALQMLATHPSLLPATEVGPSEKLQDALMLERMELKFNSRTNFFHVTLR